MIGGLWPIPLVVAFYFLTASGYLSFGGGEKDIVLIIPVAFVSLLYIIVYVSVSLLRWSVGKCVFVSLLAATVISAFVVFLLGPGIIGIKW